MNKTTFLRFILLVAAFTVISNSISYGENASLSIGSPIPAIDLPTLSGDPLNADTFKGKPTILTFFASWSKSCIDNLKFLKALQNKFKGIEIVAVSFDNKSANVSSFLKKNDFSFTSLIDKKHKYLDDFQILIIPTTFLVDKDGTLKNIYVNFDRSIQDSMTADINTLLTTKKTD